MFPERIERGGKTSSRSVRTLVVGGENSFVQRVLSKNLARFGRAGNPIQVDWHWEWNRKTPADIPHNCDLLYICVDMVGHRESGFAKDRAKERGIPVVLGTRKWVETMPRLRSAGFSEIIEREEELPKIKPPAEQWQMSARRREILERSLCENPNLRNVDLRSAVAKELNMDARVVPFNDSEAAEVRRALGISVSTGRRGSHSASIDGSLFEPACRARGINPGVHLSLAAQDEEPPASKEEPQSDDGQDNEGEESAPPPADRPTLQQAAAAFIEAAIEAGYVGEVMISLDGRRILGKRRRVVVVEEDVEFEG